METPPKLPPVFQAFEQQQRQKKQRESNGLLELLSA